MTSEDVVLPIAALQPSIVLSGRTVPTEAPTRATATLLSAAESLRLAMVAFLVRLWPDCLLDPIEPLRSYQPLIRLTPGMLDDDTVASHVATSGRRDLPIGGVSSEIAIPHAALGARRLGYGGYILSGRRSGLGARSEEVCAEMRSAGPTISNLSSFLTGFVHRVDEAAARAVFPAPAQHWGWNS